MNLAFKLIAFTKRFNNNKAVRKSNYMKSIDPARHLFVLVIFSATSSILFPERFPKRYRITFSKNFLNMFSDDNTVHYYPLTFL